MEEKTGAEIFLEHIPALSVWYKALCTYLAQLLIFVFVLFFFWWTSSNFLIGALVGQFIVIFCGTYPYRYLVKNSEKIRGKYHEKYDKLAGQMLWYHYQSYTIPLMFSSLYFPILLNTYDIIPTVIPLQTHVITNSLLPIYFAIPLAILLVILGILIKKPSGGFDVDYGGYLYVMYPEKGKLIIGGIYQYIRNPRYLSRGLISLGFGIFANSLLAIGVALIYFLAFVALIRPEDEELTRRFGDDFLVYKKKVPALIPRYGNWKKFLELMFK